MTESSKLKSRRLAESITGTWFQSLDIASLMTVDCSFMIMSLTTTFTSIFMRLKKFLTGQHVLESLLVLLVD